METVGFLLEHILLPGEEGKGNYVLHVLACKLQGSNSFDEVIVLTELLHHGLLCQEAAWVGWAHQNALQTKHPANVAVEQRLVVVNVVAHLLQNPILGA